MMAHKKHKPLPDVSPCTCGSQSLDMENWKDRHRIIKCGNCNRTLWRDTWRELIEAWNIGLSGGEGDSYKIT